jgi:hypothetical protein
VGDVAEDVDDAGFGHKDRVAGADEDVGVEGVVGFVGEEGADTLTVFAAVLDDDVAIGGFGEATREREDIHEGASSGEMEAAGMRDLSDDCNGLRYVFFDEDGDLGVEKEFAVAVTGGDTGSGLGGREFLDGDIADEREGDFAGVEDADALVEFGFAEDGDTEEVAGANEEAFGGCCRGGLGFGRSSGELQGGGAGRCGLLCSGDEGKEQEERGDSKRG